MEPMEVKKRGRGRPRKRSREEDEIDKKVEMAIKKQALEMRWRPLVGRYVLKEFDDTGVFLGKIVSYDSGLYRVDYEDGDCEDMDSGELRRIILGDDYFDDDLSERRKKLDQLVIDKSLKNKKDLEKGVADLKTEADRVETSALTELSGEAGVENVGMKGESDADSSSNSCEYAQDGDLEPEVDVPVVPPPELPPSSGNVGVPDECVSHIFSVYGFLRSFNIRLFLSPFTLDDLVGAVNCNIQNTLLDAIHVALLRSLRGQLQTLSSDGSELASKCLRCIDWSLLDSFTWPVYLVHYFTIMGYVQGPEWKGFYDDVFMRDYYSSSVSRKLMILQILCDDVLDCQELRAEIDMREESEVGIDLDALPSNLRENGPRRVHPRYSKTSACKDREAMEIIAESQGTKSSCSSKHMGFNGLEGEASASDVGVDGNSDECRLCGMDGTLLCCDGCPSAYHSRCIGVGKMYIPEGPWYCPECTINKLGPTIVAGTSLKGAELFGVDLYEQVFLGTCDHLLVLKSSTSTEPYMRYYNRKDIPKVLQMLSSVQHRSSYLEISKAIAHYWKIPQSVISHFEPIERGLCISSVKEVEKSSTVALPSACKESHKVAYTGETETPISINVSNVDNVPVFSSVSATMQADPCGISSNSDATNSKYCHLMNIKLPEPIKVESTGSVNQQLDTSDVAHHSSVDRSSVITTCTSANSDGSHIGQVNAASLPAFVLSQSKEDNYAGAGTAEINLADNFMYVGTFFKPYAYINHYVHGDLAASAAANLAVLLSEESRISEAHKSSGVKKATSDISLQIKAFSAVASRFFWPSSDKKLVEVPRERCGWCHSCKLPSSNRRGCMLNSAALTATKGAMKILYELRPTLSGEGSLPSISTYILYMGKVLCGLTVGPFMSQSYRKQWCGRVQDSSTLNAIKGPLLELEENIRGIALSVEWAKATDDWLVDSPMVQCAANNAVTAQKRGPGGKQPRKHSGLSETRHNISDDKSFVWWQGGKLLKLVFHKAILPRLVVKRAARRGGSRKISGVYYVDDPVHPKRSRQMVWRAAVERSKNASQLALQVRYLDHHVRWNDLVRPDQNLQEGKGPETEASVFRNAVICDKKLHENKIRYGVAFGNQKHLPSRIMKSIIEIEQSEDGKEKYWFSEVHVPLYLIKEYEERINKGVGQPADKSSTKLSELQRRQLKASRKDIFLYLTYKRDKLERCSCASCQCDVLIRNVVKCSACQGYCHKDCTISSTVNANEEVEFLITCKQCYKPKVALEHGTGSPMTPLPMQGRESQYALTASKGLKIKLHNQPSISVKTQESTSDIKQATSTSRSGTKLRSKNCSWGVIWMKNNTKDTGVDFRRKNILYKDSSERPGLICNLCKKAYNCNLMFIHCETCNGWFHAEAVELDETKLPSVVGFKCCRCRRIKSPRCPYEDNSEGKKPVDHKTNEKVSKRKVGVNFDPETIVKSQECKPSTMLPAEEGFVPENDPLLFSLSRVEQITEDNSKLELEWNGSGLGPQKLPVRRLTKPQADTEGMLESNYHAQSLVPLDGNDILKPKEELCSGLGWYLSTNGLEGGVQFDYDINYEDMEFEPQTYFSFTELLEGDDGGQVDGLDASGDVLGHSESQSCTVQRDAFPEQCAAGKSSNQLEPAIDPKSSVNSNHCKMCSHSEPVPDLLCGVCNLLIHSHCSPWVDSSFPDGTWRCGTCRECR